MTGIPVRAIRAVGDEPFVTLPDVGLVMRRDGKGVVQTRKAVLIHFTDGADRWVPRSQIVHEYSAEERTIWVTLWWAQRAKLLPDRDD